MLITINYLISEGYRGKTIKYIKQVKQNKIYETNNIKELKILVKRKFSFLIKQKYIMNSESIHLIKQI